MELDYTGYLFCYFTGTEESLEEEQVYFSISRDGLHWTDLNERQPVLKSTIGTGGVRDPFIIRVKEENKYVILATDLHIASGTDWESAVCSGSTRIVCWESKDLINWSSPYFFDTGMKDAGCVWAPEAIYDKKTESYMVFWSSLMLTGEERKQKIYCCNTKDFHEFSEPELYMEKDENVIDTTMIYYNGTYFRFSKDESAGKIMMEKSKKLMNRSYESVKVPLFEEIEGVEGPAIFQFHQEEKWCLLLDRFKEQRGYMPLITKDLESGAFEILPESEYDFGELKKRHGSVMELTEEEWCRLEKHYN